MKIRKDNNYNDCSTCSERENCSWWTEFDRPDALPLSLVLDGDGIKQGLQGFIDAHKSFTGAICTLLDALGLKAGRGASLLCHCYVPLPPEPHRPPDEQCECSACIHLEVCQYPEAGCGHFMAADGLGQGEPTEEQVDTYCKVRYGEDRHLSIHRRLAVKALMLWRKVLRETESQAS